MVSRVAAVLGVSFLCLSAGLWFIGSAGSHSYHIVIHKVGNAYTVEKDTAYFEVDYNYTTTFTIENDTGGPVDFAFDEWEPSGHFCVVSFSPPGTQVCQTPRISLNSGSTVVTATARDLMPMYYFWPYDPYPSSFLVAAPGDALAPLDPEIEIDRDGVSPIVTLLLALMFGGVWWFRRNRAQA